MNQSFVRALMISKWFLKFSKKDVFEGAFIPSTHTKKNFKRIVPLHNLVFSSKEWSIDWSIDTKFKWLRVPMCVWQMAITYLNFFFVSFVLFCLGMPNRFFFVMNIFFIEWFFSNIIFINRCISFFSTFLFPFADKCMNLHLSLCFFLTEQPAIFYWFNAIFFFMKCK